MKRYGLAALGVIAIVVGMVWLLQGVPTNVHENVLKSVSTTQTTAASVVEATAAVNAAAQKKSAVAPGQAASASQDPGLDKAAIFSMRAAREHGDPRAPPMSPPAVERDPPTAAELADPDLYAGYEKSQQLKAYQRYVNAVPKKVETLQKALDEAKQPGSGITPEQMAFAQKKMADLNAMQQKLLAENPGLKPPASHPMP